jgi:hypothetical protein
LVSAAFGLLAAVSLPAAAENTYATNPLGFFFDDYFNRIAEYQHPTAMLVTGRCNRAHDNFRVARQEGAEVLAYVNPVDYQPNPACSDDRDLYPESNPQANYWPYPSRGARANYASKSGTTFPLADLTVNSAWSNHVVDYVEGLMRGGLVDGVFLDVLGARLWSSRAAFSTWPQWEQDAWTQGSIDLVRRLDTLRNQINPRFIIVNNNTWNRSDSEGHDDGLGHPGENYVDGICYEHHEVFAAEVLAKPYSGKHRRVLVISKNSTNNDADSTAWANIQGVTHVSNQAQTDTTDDKSPYDSPDRVNPVGLHVLGDRLLFFGQTVGGTIPSAGMTPDYKRASKVTLSQRGRLRELSAVLDGDNGVSGSQTLKLVIYADNNGVPGAKVVESNPRTLSAGSAKRWYSFSVDNVLLQPGDYWIAIFTSGTGQVLRNYGETTTAANWYGNPDPYADGASATFGAATTGNATLSVRGGYSPE